MAYLEWGSGWHMSDPRGGLAWGLRGDGGTDLTWGAITGNSDLVEHLLLLKAAYCYYLSVY